MEQIYFGERIAANRKRLGLTQEALAQKLEVTNQAVSKWESDQCCPDIMLLPEIAKVFGISLDELFGLQKRCAEMAPQIEPLPWEDNDDLHAVLFKGHKLIDYSAGLHKHFAVVSFGQNDPGRQVELKYNGTCGDIISHFSVSCSGDVAGNIDAGSSVNCRDVNGNVRAGASVNCGNVGGNANAGAGIRCGNVAGHVTAGTKVECGSVEGSVSAGTKVIYSGKSAKNE